MSRSQLNFSRRRFLKSIGALALSAVGGFYYSTNIETEWLSVEHVKIPVPRLPSALEGLKIVQLSDFHLHPYTQIDFIKTVVDEANALKPDLIALTGDYVLGSVQSIFELAPVLGRLNAAYGIYAVFGNHDLWTNVNVVEQGLRSVGISVLRNQAMPIQIKKSVLYVAGLDDGWSGRPDLKGTLQSVSPGEPVILLMHEPDFADEYAEDGRITLQLSGHSHGGQIRIPGIGALELPRYAMKYDQGLYKIKDLWLYTNRGIGVIGPPVRFNCRPEITEITLVSDAGDVT